MVLLQPPAILVFLVPPLTPWNDGTYLAVLVWSIGYGAAPW